MQESNTRIIISAQDEASKVFRRAGMEAEGLTNRVSSLSGAVRGLAAFGGLSMVGMSVSEAIGKFGEYETALTDMAKVTDRDLGLIRKDIASINPVLGDSTELMRGYYQVISAGVVDPVKSMNMLQVASRASQAAHVSQSETIKALTKVMAGFGDELGTAAEASDLLFAIERQGQTSFSELVPVVGDLAKISSEASVSTSEMGASMSLLTQTSGTTAEAATKYKQMLINLLKPTAEMTKAFTALGYESGNALIADKGIVQSLQMLKRYASGAGISMSKLFESSEAFMGVSALLANNGKTLADNIEAIGSAAGSTDKAFEKWSKTSAALEQKFSNVYGNTLSTFGEAFAPSFHAGLDSISDWVTSHGDEIQNWAQGTGDAVGSLGSKLSGLYSIYSSVPDEITGAVGAGIVGRYLFGSTPAGQAVAALWAINEGMATLDSLMGTSSSLGGMWDSYQRSAEGFNKFFEYLPDYTSGKRSFWNSELNPDYFKEQSKEIDVSNDLAELKRAAKYSAVSAAGVADPVVSKVKKTDGGAGSSGTGKADDKQLQARKRAREKFNQDYNQLLSDPYDFERKQIEAQKAVWEKAGVDHVQLANWETVSLVELDEKYQADKLRSQSAFNSAYSQEFLDPYLMERKAIKEQARIYREDGNNKVKVDKWEKSQLAKQEREHTALIKAENKKRIEEEKKAAREKLLASDDFFGGMALGYEQMLEDQKTWAQRGVDIFNDFATSSKSALGDLGFDALTGQLKSFSDYWDSFWSGMARSITNHVADLAVNKGMDMLMSMGGGLFDMAGTFAANYFHTGNVRLKADEVAAVLQEGEMVIPAQQAETIRQAVGGDGISKGQFFDNVVDYVSVGKQSGYADSFNNMQRDAYGWDMLGVAGQSLLSGLGNAYSNYTTVGQQADLLRNQGINVSQSSVDSLQASSAMSGFTGSFFPTFAGGMMGAWGNRMLGLNDGAFNIAGLKFDSSTIGNILGSAAGMFLGGPAASIVSGVLSPTFSLAVSGIADAFDVREYETVRDKLEADLGFVGGRVAFSTFQDAFAPSAIESGQFSWGFGLETFTQAEIAQLIEDKMKAISGIGKDPDPVGRALSSAHMFGNAYTSQMMDSEDPADQTSIASAIKTDLGFFGYTAREFAAKQLGGYEDAERGHYYTAAGKRVDINSVENPFSAAALAAAQDAVDRANNAGQYSGGTIGGSGYDWGNSWDASRDSTGSGSRDTSGMGNESSGGKSGYGGTSGGSGYTGGRRHGGPVYSGETYRWQEPGLPGEIFMPQNNGFVMNHEDSSVLTEFFSKILDGQKNGAAAPVAASSGASGPLVVNLVVDGSTIASALIPHLLTASTNGEQFVHADTLIER